MDAIQRTLRQDIIKRIGQNKVLLLYGTRRVGKTSLLKDIAKEYEGSTLMLNGEDHEVRLLLANQTAGNYRNLAGDKKIIMIDEAQSIADIGQHLKFMIDVLTDVTIIATGSSSFDLMNKSGEPLTGRSYQYTMYPVSFGEITKYSGFVNAYSAIDDLLIFGSYPEILTMTGKKDKEQYLRELVNNYLLKDILTYENIRNAGKILDLLRLIAYQTGNEVSTNELGRNLQISKNTVERYLDLLSKVFVLFRIGGYNKNLRKEVVKSSKWFFWDLGLRNALISDFRPLDLRPDKGQLWENFCFYERIKLLHYSGKKPEYFFWRTYDGQELDMIEGIDNKIAAFEFKFTNKANNKVPAAFATNYPKVQVTFIDKKVIGDFLLP